MPGKVKRNKVPPIHCAHDKMIPIEEMVEHPKNPNRHSPSQIMLLAKIIGGQGWRAPIVVSKLSGYIVAGHARLNAAQLLELPNVPVNLQEFKSEADEISHLIADNRIAELATMNQSGLKELLIELDAGNVDMDFTGYTTQALSELMEELDGPDPDKPKIICPHCGEQFS